MMKKFIIFLLCSMSFNVIAETLIVVPTTAGGVYDVFARQYAKYLQTKSGENYVVENHPGAGQLIATKYFSKSPPNTLMITSNSYYTFVAKDEVDASGIIPVNLLASTPLVFIAKKELTCENLKDPSKKYFVGTGGIGSATSQALSLIMEKYPNITEVPYKSAGAASSDFMAGRLDGMISTGFSREKIMGFNVLTHTSSHSIDNIKPWKECLGITKTLNGHFLLLASKGSSPEFVNKINKLSSNYVKDNDTKKYYSLNGMTAEIKSNSEINDMVFNSIASERWILK